MKYPLPAHYDHRALYTAEELKRERMNLLLRPLVEARVNHRVDANLVTVVVPKQYDPGPYTGPDGTDCPAMFMGVPIEWSDDGACGLRYDRPPTFVAVELGVPS